MNINMKLRTVLYVCLFTTTCFSRTRLLWRRDSFRRPVHCILQEWTFLSTFTSPIHELWTHRLIHRRADRKTMIMIKTTCWRRHRFLHAKLVTFRVLLFFHMKVKKGFPKFYFILVIFTIYRNHNENGSRLKTCLQGVLIYHLSNFTVASFILSHPRVLWLHIDTHSYPDDSSSCVLLSSCETGRATFIRILRLWKSNCAAWI